MKNIKYLMTFVVVAVAAFIVGCSKADNANASANANKATTNANSSASSNSNATAPQTTSDTASVGSMATPTDVYKTAYDCRKRKDIECLKKVMSKDILDFLKMMGEEDKKSLDDTLKELCDRPQAATAEARNEKITGDTATIEYLAEDGSWQPMDFEKSGSQWKMGAPKGAPKPGDATKKP